MAMPGPLPQRARRFLVRVVIDKGVVETHPPLSCVVSLCGVGQSSFGRTVQ